MAVFTTMAIIVFDNDRSHFTGRNKVDEGALEKMSLQNGCRKLSGTMQTVLVAALRLRHGPRRLEKLGRRKWKAVYDGRLVVMMTLSEYDLEPRIPGHYLPPGLTDSRAAYTR